MKYSRWSIIGLGFLSACILACGRTEIDGPFGASTIPITTGAAGDGQPTGGAGTGAGGSTETGTAGQIGQAGSTETGTAGQIGQAGSTETGTAGNSQGSAGEAGTGEGGAAGSSSSGASGSGAAGSGAAGSGAAGSSQGGAGGLPLNTVCDPVAQNCADGLRCDLPDSGALAFICIMDAGGSGGEGQMCQESSQDCAKGGTCIQPVGRRGQPIGSATCFVFCNTAADCPSGNACTAVGVFNDGGDRVRTGICQPAAPTTN